MAKRFVIASTFFSSPALAYAVDDAPRLHVAEQRLILVEPTNGKPVVAEKTPLAAPPAVAEARTARLPTQPVELPSRPVDDGWVAREHIDKRAPLRDPLAITAPQRASQPSSAAPAANGSAATGALSLDQLRGPQASMPESAAEQDLAAEIELTPEQAPAAEQELAPALQGLTPVPRMRPQSPPATQAPQQTVSPRQTSPDSESVFENLAPARERAIPVRRPDLTRGMEQDPVGSQGEPSETIGSADTDSLGLNSPTADAHETDSVSAGSVSSDSSAAGQERPTQLRDLIREPAAHNEGDAPGKPSTADADEEAEAAAGNQGYVGDWDEQDWQREHSAPAAKVAPQKTPLVITPTVQRMRAPMEAALVYHFQRPEKAPERSSWGMLHSMMVYGVETQVIAGRQRYNLVAWMAGNNICRGQRIFTVDREGISPRSGVGLQGHQGQFLAVFGLIGVPDSYPLYVGKQKFSVADLVAREQANCRSGEELTFTLIGLSHYLDTDATWTSSDGEQWDFERVIQEELDQQVIGAACGGTHRLMGLSHALRIRREQGKPVEGQWARADQFINDFVDYAWKLQNPDGSMSTDWFEGRADRNDLDRKVQTTGHIVEWLIGVMPDDQLQDPRMVRAVGFLTNALYRNRNKEWEIGPKGHALRSLALYHDRVYGDPPPWRASAVARRSASGHHHRSR